MLALTECGYNAYTTTHTATLPEQWAAGAHRAWFMPCYDNDGTTTPHADAEWWKAAMGSSIVIPLQ